MNIAVFGCGYVGLVTAAGLADIGHNVIGIDKNPHKIERLTHGDIPIYEPGLEPIVQKSLRSGKLRFTEDSAPAVRDASVIFITVGTPSLEDGSADLSQVEAVAKEIASQINNYKVIVDKSTVPVGTARWVRRIILKHCHAEAIFDVVSNPEFLREGSAVLDFLHPDRIVIGLDSQEAKTVMADLYQVFLENRTPTIWTTPETAELIKYASNGFLATKITYINELAFLCESVGADVMQVAEGMGLDHRIGPDFLRPGPGYGGSCFPKDTRALLQTAIENARRLSIVQATVTANDLHKQEVADKIRRSVGELCGKTIALLGLAFKADTDDMRESPSIPVVRELLKAGAAIQAYDPAAVDEACTLFGTTISYVDDPYKALHGADAAVILTDWDLFRHLDPHRIVSLMKNPKLIDLRNMMDANLMKSSGINYEGIGRL